MKAQDALILYTPAGWPAGLYVTQGEVYVSAIGADRGAWDRYAYKVGACFSEVRNETGIKALARVLLTFQTMVVRDGIDPQVAHKAFLKIDEYADAMAPELVP